MLRYIQCLLLPGLILLSGCRPADRTAPLTVVDLLREFDQAEQRPSAAFRLVTYASGGVTRPAIAAPSPGRVIWQLPFPREAIFRTFVALDRSSAPPAAIRFRVGVSDDRIYEGLTETVLEPDAGGWTELRADLSAYAGWKWSLFYRPDRVRWRLVLSADAAGGLPGAGLWGSPEILADAQSALEYAKRRRQMR